MQLTPAATFWIDEHLPEDRLTFAGAVVVEHRLSPISFVARLSTGCDQMKTAYLKTSERTLVSIRIPGKQVHTLRLEFAAGCTVRIAYEGEAEDIGFKEWEAEHGPTQN